MQEKKRSFFVVVGDRQKDVIVNLYHILLNVDIKLNKSVLWAYKNKLLGFTRFVGHEDIYMLQAKIHVVIGRSARRRSRRR